MILILVILSACTIDDGINTRDEVAELININVDAITHFIEFEDAKLIFYKPREEQHSVGMGWIRKKGATWKWAHGTEITNSNNEPLSFAWSNLDDSRSHGPGSNIFWGIINNDDIQKVHISAHPDYGLDHDAQIITVGNHRVWYVLVDHYFGVPSFHLVGYSNSGEIVFEQKN